MNSAARVQRWLWDRRAGRWDHHGSSGLEQVVDAVLRTADPDVGAVAVDLGCGTGQVSLPLARSGLQVTAVDVSPEMISRLEAKAEQDGLDGVVGVVSPIESFELPSDTVDLVVTNYALHHLRDHDKETLVRSVARWLRPGGRFVVGDMMFGRGSTVRDRQIIRSKVATLARRGPAGWWRVAKNAVRFGLRLGERPVAVDRWQGWLEESGFAAVSAEPVVGEAAVITGIKVRPA